MNRFKTILSKAPNIIKPQPVVQEKKVEIIYPKCYDKLKKDGPELLISKILNIHGPLQNKEIWRVYNRMVKENDKAGKPDKINYFQSLTKLKQTLRLMRIHQKIKSNGYDRKAKQFKGWLLNEKRAYKYVHPQAVKKIHQLKDNKDIL